MIKQHRSHHLSRNDGGDQGCGTKARSQHDAGNHGDDTEHAASPRPPWDELERLPAWETEPEGCGANCENQRADAKGYERRQERMPNPLTKLGIDASLKGKDKTSQERDK